MTDVVVTLIAAKNISAQTTQNSCGRPPLSLIATFRKSCDREPFWANTTQQITMATQISRANAKASKPVKDAPVPQHEDRESGSEGESETEEEMTAEEKALNAMVMGDDGDFMAGLRGEAMDEESDKEDADLMNVEGEEDNDNLENVDDAEVWTSNQFLAQCTIADML